MAWISREPLSLHRPSKDRLWIIVIGLLILGLINLHIYQQEQLLTHGERVRFELAPVDPRSLMQGDYMALNFTIAAKLHQGLVQANHDGVFVVALDQHQVGHYVALYEGQALLADQRLIQYRIRDGRLKLASNAFFFEEGRAEHFNAAKYGEFSVSEDGKLLLSNMLDADFNLL